MKNYYEKGDEIEILSGSIRHLSESLRKYSYKDDKGRFIIQTDILYTTGKVKAVKEGTGHLEVLYQPKGKTHSWWLPTTIIKPLNN